MKIKLRTGCGCEKVIEPYFTSPPLFIELPIYPRQPVLDAGEPFPASVQFKVRRFQYHGKKGEFYDYREKIET